MRKTDTKETVLQKQESSSVQVHVLYGSQYVNVWAAIDFPNAINRYELTSDYLLSNLANKCNTKKSMSSLTREEPLVFQE